jgi:hypothetical protein
LRRHLHIDRAGTLSLLTNAQVGHRRTDYPDPVEAAMLEKALVLGRDDGVDENLGQVVETDYAALFAGTVKKIGDQLGLDLGGFASDAVRNLGDPGDGA